MKQAKFSLTPDQIEFLSRHEKLGFPDKSSLVREALDVFHRKLREDRVRESAELYSQIYLEDEDLQNLTEAGLEDWPE